MRFADWWKDDWYSDGDDLGTPLLALRKDDPYPGGTGEGLAFYPHPEGVVVGMSYDGAERVYLIFTPREISALAVAVTGTATVPGASDLPVEIPREGAGHLDT